MRAENRHPDAHGFRIRDACIGDLDEICDLGGLLNTVNLPANKTELEKVLWRSEHSFALREGDVANRAFLFALVDETNRVMGCAQVFAKAGTFEVPLFYFQVSQDERYSKTLKKYFRHPTLRLMQCHDGPTELGSLVLKKHLRSRPEKLGRMLSYVRFLFIAMQRHLFSEHLIAELLPPLGPKFESALWDAIGRKFTGLDYYEADMLSRESKEFVETLFPKVEILVSLLPPAAQEVIGQVGNNSRGAAHLLKKIGFRYSHRVNAFDGGPNYEAMQSDISLIRHAITAEVHRPLFSKPIRSENIGMIAAFHPDRPSGQRFWAVQAAHEMEPKNNAMHLSAETLRQLGCEEGNVVGLIDARLW